MINNNSMDNSEKRGTWCAIISGLLYGLLGYFGVTLLNSGFSAYNTSFWRFFASSLFLLIIVIAKQAYKKGTLRQCLLVVANGGIFYGAPGILFLLASRYISTGQSIVIFFIFPVFVMVLNRIFLKEPIKPQYVFSFVLILFGLLMLVDLSEARFDLAGIGLSLLSAFCYANYVFISKHKVNKALPALYSSLLVSLGCMTTGGVASLIHGSWAWPSEPAQWFNIFGLGIICSALPILFLFAALEHISADKASLLSVLEPVFVVIFGVLLLGEVLTLSSAFGIGLILLGAIIVTLKLKTPSFFKTIRG